MSKGIHLDRFIAQQLLSDDVVEFFNSDRGMSFLAFVSGWPIDLSVAGTQPGIGNQERILINRVFILSG